MEDDRIRELLDRLRDLQAEAEWIRREVQRLVSLSTIEPHPGHAQTYVRAKKNDTERENA